MGRACEADSEWLRAVLDEYESRLVQYARRITGDLELARDAVQDTFLRLCAEPRGKVDEYVGPWLFRVCRSRALDLVKARRPEEGEEELEAVPSHDEPPQSVLEHKEQLREVMRLIGHLPNHQQEVIRLKFQHGFSYKEISAITGLSIGNVGFLIHVGIKTIKREIESVAPPKERALRRIK